MAEGIAKVSISLPPDLLTIIDAAARAKDTSRSRFIADVLRDKAEQDERQRMIEGYKAMAETNRQLAEEHLSAAAEVWPPYGD